MLAAALAADQCTPPSPPCSQVCGNVRLPSPAARYSPQSGQLMLGEGAFQLHLAQVNAVVHM